MLECVVNVSEGTNRSLLDALVEPLGKSLLDLHTDPHHNRAVFTLAGPDLDEALRALAAGIVELGDLRSHEGVHPRLGLLDVVPFVPISEPLGPDPDLGEAIAARDRFATFAATSLGLPCFLYGPERSLPAIRRRAFVDLAPDLGPSVADPRLGAVCVGARAPLIAYNLVLVETSVQRAREVARGIRSDAVRALGFALGKEAQVSCNLVQPWVVGPAELYDRVVELAPIARTELVGLLPEAVLRRIPPERYPALDLDATRTIESRLHSAQ